jgi:hypothetical protein
MRAGIELANEANLGRPGLNTPARHRELNEATSGSPGPGRPLRSPAAGMVFDFDGLLMDTETTMLRSWRRRH